MIRIPETFLHRVDHRADRIIWVEASPQDLHNAVFLDGRTKFWRRERPQSLSAALAARRDVTRPVTRLICHVSFCGSTLLASAIGRASHALMLKEAHCLVDLADWQIEALRSADSAPRLTASLELALQALHALHAAGPTEMPAVIKPSNWANALLPLLCADPAAIRPVFITMERAAFLVAVLRGGRERLAFTARVAAHLAGLFADGPALVAQALAATRDPLRQTTKLVMLAHHFQHRLFDDACRAGGWGDDRIFDFSEIVGDLANATRRAASALEIDMRAVQPSALGEVSCRNAKQPDRSFSRATETSDNAFVRGTYQDHIAAALAWARDHLEPLDIDRQRDHRSPQRSA